MRFIGIGQTGFEAMTGFKKIEILWFWGNNSEINTRLACVGPWVQSQQKTNKKNNLRGFGII